MSLLDVLVVRWPSGLFILFGVVTVPLYFLVVFGILHGRRRSSRFKSSYYNLVLSQALVDAIAVSSDTFTFIFRYSGLFKEFFWEHRRLLAPYSFNSNHLFMMVRVFGDCLVSLQRFFVLCYPFTSFQKYFSHTPLICIMLVHWSVPILISLPITLNFNRTFDTPDTLLTVIQPTDQQLASCLEVIYQLITFSISITAYLFVFKIIVGSRSSGGLTREMRLSLIVMGQSIAFGLSLVFYTTQFIVVQLALTDAVIQLRNYYPLLTGFESFSNPWLQIAVNCDLRREIQRMFGMRKEVSGSAKDSQSRLNNRVGTTDAT